MLVLLTALSNAEDQLIFQKPGKVQAAADVYQISDFATNGMKSGILFVHSFSGCNSTSATYYKGKVRFWDLFKNSSRLQAIANTFNNAGSSAEDILRAGCKAFLIWFGAPIDEISVNKWRYILFKKESCFKRWCRSTNALPY